MYELNLQEVDEVSGGRFMASAGMGVVSGILWVGAEMTVAAPPVSGFLALGAAIVGLGAAVAGAAGH